MAEAFLGMGATLIQYSHFLTAIVLIYYLPNLDFEIEHVFMEIKILMSKKIKYDMREIDREKI